ncbi:MAG: ferredoxin reductase [Kineosporiaceae bacterium]
MTEAQTPTRRTTNPPRWHEATLRSRHREAADAVTLVLDVPTWPGHRAGQYVDLKLTAEDGYSARRSYSIASAADGTRVELTVQAVADGEVSSYLVGEMQPGDQLELLGPIGGWFVWTPEQTEPVLLVGGGSGVVPLMSMVRTRNATGSRAPVRLLYSVRSPAYRLFTDELVGSGVLGTATGSGVDVAVLYTREAPAGTPREPGRLSAADLAAHGWPAEFEPTVYVCGPTPFVEHASGLLVALGHDPSRIRTERFGPTR